jgi:hypothetical protein
LILFDPDARLLAEWMISPWRARIRNRLRSVTRGVLTIGYQARSPKTRDALVHSYRKLVTTTRAVLRDADTMVRRLGQRRRTATAVTAAVLQRAQQQLQQMRPLVDRVVAQTRARVLGGDTHVPDKVLSVLNRIPRRFARARSRSRTNSGTW